LFVRDYKLKYSKPLLAVGMGANGQLSRITSPISLVTHPLIPFPSAPGQLSLAQVHQARHLIGQLPKREISVVGEESVAEKVSCALQAAFVELGYPYLCSVRKEKNGDIISELDVTGLDSTSSMARVVGEEFTRYTGRPAPWSVIENCLH
jgi:Type I 3-dehydroquinase